MTQKKCVQEAACASAFLAFCLFMAFYGIPREITLNTLWGGSSTGVPSRTFPYFAIAIMMIASLVQLFCSIFRYIELRKIQEKEIKDKIEWAKEFRSLLVFACCVLYMILFETVGYLIATLIAPALVLLVLRDLNWKHYLSVYIVGGLMYLIFQYLLKINLP